MRTNYVLIDYENVQPDSLAGLDAEHFTVVCFVGAGQNRLSFDVVDAMQRLGHRAQYVKIAGNGPNALDFHIAFYIGDLAAADPTAYFHIISRDTGFDPLIAHLKARKVPVVRSNDSRVRSLLCTLTAEGEGRPEGQIFTSYAFGTSRRPDPRISSCESVLG